ncbi:hypothetical protein [Inquilinus sp.]|uniref:hypothetical protein n=1 Tax=Inquilinus sp. TaxID=1932117 RepID=UPI0031D9BFCF
MATPKRRFTIRHYFIEPGGDRVLKASSKLLDGIMARRRHIPDWAGMKVRMIEVIVRIAGDRLHVASVKGTYMHFDATGHWDQPREAQVAIAHLELAYPGDLPDDHHRRRFIQRRVAASRWHVGTKILSEIQDDIESSDRARRVKAVPPWRWVAPEDVTDPW